LLSFIHRPESHHQAIQGGDWQASNDFSFWIQPITELSGKTLGIVGLGRIGRATARVATALGMKVVAYSRREINPLAVPGFQWLSLEQLFATSDVISLHCPQTNENAGFVNSELISQMKPTAILVNAARGGLVNEQDLADALNSDRIGGAVLDVVSTEPIADNNPLLTAKHCLMTPHVAWATVEARQRLMQTTAENVAAFIAGSPIHVVN
jgi:glycerate dehydrogenase